MKNFHEIRDPIHIFIKLSSDEKKIVDSLAFQRLRGIHQLALTYLVYPGASHKRFEHSLGVMELAGRVYDVIKANIKQDFHELLPELYDKDKSAYWRKVLRVAALLHDVGHLPFSHAAESELLPENWDHEKLTKEIILSNEMREIFESFDIPIKPEQVAKLAVGKRKAKDLTFTRLEEVLSEIIIGDYFGVDRIDYLLRDSYHTGVGYGKFDHYRLIDTLRLLIRPKQEGSEEEVVEIGVEGGGIHTAESLLLARYFMFTQVYLHPVRRIYDKHLGDFLREWLDGGKFSVDLKKHLALTDSEVLTALKKNSQDAGLPGHIQSKIIINRQHFKLLYEKNGKDVIINPECAKLVYDAAVEKFGQSNVKFDPYSQTNGLNSFPVLDREGRVLDSLSESSVLKNLPVASCGYVFISRELEKESKKWLGENREKIINQPLE